MSGIPVLPARRSAPLFSRQNAWNAAMRPAMSRPSGVAQGVCGIERSMRVCSSRERYRPMISAYIRFEGTSAPFSSRRRPRSCTKR